MPTRRRYGRGSLRREGAQWVLRIRGEAPADGGARSERTIKIGAIRELKTRAAARLEADRRMALLGAADRLHGQRALVADYLDTYLVGRVDILKANSRGAFKTYAGHLRRELKGRYLDEVTIGVAQRLISTLYGRRLARSTIHAILSFLRRLQRSARAEGIATVIIGPRELAFPKDSKPRRPPRSFSIDETRRILAAARWPWRALYALQAYLGLRAGEALGIEWSDIDFRAKVVRVSQQASHGRVSSTKSSNSTAPLPLPGALASILREYQPIWKPNGRGLLFANRQGNPLWASGVRRNHLQPLLKRLGIRPAGFHAWRHALATEAFRGGASAAAVRQLLRHGSILVTMRYSRVSFDDLVSASDTVARNLANAGPSSLDAPPAV